MSVAESTSTEPHSAGAFDRRVSPEMLALLKPVSNYVSTPIDFCLSKIIAALLESKDVQVTSEFLVHLTNTVVVYLHNLVDKVKKFTEVQRRSKPSVSDVRNTLRFHKLAPADLYIECQLAKRHLVNRKKLDEVQAQAKQALAALERDELPQEADEAMIFFMNQTYEITQLVPRQSSKPTYIPSYFPELPPDYTYKNTPKYTETLTDMEKLRIKLVEESRLTETSLYNLIDQDSSNWKTALEKELNAPSPPDSLMGDDAGPITDTETPAPMEEEHAPAKNDSTSLDLASSSDKAFDFVAYAKKRASARQRREQEIEHRRKLWNANIFIQAEKYISPYATKEYTRDVKRAYKDLLKTELVKVVKAVRAGEQQKKIKIEELKAEKEKREQEKAKERDTIEFGFNFGDANGNIGSDSDAEEDMDEIIFGESEPLDQPSSVPPTGSTPAVSEALHYDSEGANADDANNEMNAAVEPRLDSENDMEAELEDVVQTHSDAAPMEMGA